MILKDPDFGSLHEFFLNSAYKIHSPEHVFLMEKEKNAYKNISYKEAILNINQWAAYMHHIGLKKGDKVSIILDNCPEFIYLDQALQKLGAVNVSIYPTLTAEETAFILNDSDSKFVLVGNPFLLKKFQKVESVCPKIEKIFIAFNTTLETEKYISVKKLKEIGAEKWPVLQKEIEAILPSIKHDDLAALIYTSGTTGVPKGTMLSHYNFMSNCYDAKDLCPTVSETDRFLSFLP